MQFDSFSENDQPLLSEYIAVFLNTPTCQEKQEIEKTFIFSLPVPLAHASRGATSGRLFKTHKTEVRETSACATTSAMVLFLGVD